MDIIYIGLVIVFAVALFLLIEGFNNLEGGAK